jgi:hypothetical protein
MEEVARERGTQFGPLAAEAFLAVPEEIFLSLQAQRPEAVREVPQRVQTLRDLDPSAFAVEPLVAG